jgi:hypothetical protein
MFHRGEDYFLVRRLPVERCTQCGEVYLDHEAAMIVDKAAQHLPDAEEHLSVPVMTCPSS